MPTLSKRLRHLRIDLANKRRAKRKLPPYVVIGLRGEIAELPQPAPAIPFETIVSRFVPLPSGPQSAHWLREQFERLSNDARVRGVVLKLACEGTPAVYQSLREAIVNFRATGRRVIAFAEQFGPFQYYLACACDQIVMPPTAEWSVLGLAGEYVFFKDAFDRAGIGVDVVNVSPFKSAGDQFARSDFSEESRAQAEWLLDARYDALVHGIAHGRKLAPERVRALIDSAPLSASEAQQGGLIDAALYEDELERWLQPESPAAPEPAPEPPALRLIARIAPAWAKQIRDVRKGSQPASAVWSTFGQADKSLLLLKRDWHDKRIGVVAIAGLITRGPSRRSPLPIPLPLLGGSETAGVATVAQAIRQAEKNDDIAAVILYVDSQGGDALASDLMAREVKRLRSKKPVVAYMGGVAASGGYYVSALAQHITARPLTITGSIGVIAMKLNAQGVYDRLSLHRRALSRGANALIYSDMEALDAQSRAVFARSIGRVYGDFKAVVAEGRCLPNDDALENICGGRVWTGEQARDRKLVDQLGGFNDAMNKAIELAKLDAGGKRIGWQLVTPGKQYALPEAFAAARNALNPAAWLAQVEALRALLHGPSTWMLSEWGVEKTQ